MTREPGSHFKIEIEKPVFPHIAEGSQEPLTEEEKRKIMIRVERAERLGINVTRLDGEQEMESGVEDLEKLEALLYIMRDEEIPAELEGRLLARMKKKNQEAAFSAT